MSRGRTLLGLGCFIGALLVAGIATAILPRISHAAPNGVLLAGTVKSDSGEKLEGVTVSAKADGTTITTSVFTDQDGNFYFPRLADGQYHVWAQLVGFDRDLENVDLNGSVQHQDFLLKPTKDFAKQLPGNQWAAALAEDTPEHRKMKEVFLDNCTGCHPPSYTLQNRFDEAGWTAIINLMSRVTGPEGSFGGPDSAPFPIIYYYKKQLAAYLAEMRGPGQSPMQFKPNPRPSGEATRAVFVEYQLPPVEDGGYGPPANDGSDWSLGTPSLLDGHRGLHDTQIDFNGNFWFTNTDPSMDRTIGRVDGKTGKVTSFKVARPNGMAANSHGLVRDPDGILWFNVSGGDGAANPGSLGRLDPSTGKIEVFNPPAGMAGVTLSLDSDTQGNIWATTDTGALRFDPKTHQFKEFKSSDLDSAIGTPGSYGIAADKDGNGWWTQLDLDLVNKGTVATGETQNVKVPPKHSISINDISDDARKMYALAGVVGGSFAGLESEIPRRMAADKLGEYVWVNDNYANNVARIDIHTLKVTLFPLPIPDTGNYAATVDDHHNLWVNLTHADALAKLDTVTGKWTLFPFPTLGTETRFVSFLDRNGKETLVIGYPRVGKVARMEVRTKDELEALKTQAQEVARAQ